MTDDGRFDRVLTSTRPLPVIPEPGTRVRFRLGRHRGRWGTVDSTPSFPLAVETTRVTVALVRFPRGGLAYALLDEIEPDTQGDT